VTRARTAGNARTAPTVGSSVRLTSRVPRAKAERSELSEAADLIASASSVVLLAHIGPDADALGSALALGLAISRTITDVTVAFAEPYAVPESLRSLPGQHLIKPVDQVPAHPELVITMDVNSRERLGCLESLLDTATTSLVIDHHASNTRFGRHHLVDLSAESTTVLVVRILDQLALPIDKDIAANIYAGLATDTVGFRFASAAAHRLTARLLEAGIDPDELMRPITDLHPYRWMEMLSTVLGGAVLDQDAAGGRGLVSTVIALDTAEGMRAEELDSVIDILRTASEAQVAAVLKETSAGQWQVSLRSRPDSSAHATVPGIDVAAVAASLGGGGHVRAAGFGFTGGADQALTALRSALSAA
jgi:phosphoesterase RecJ-like protein